MAGATTIEQLRDTKFLQGIDDRYLSELAPLCRQEEFARQTTVFEEYDRAKDVYFIVDGQISLAICDSKGCRQIALVGMGELMGWSPLIGRTRLFDTARTLSPVKMLVVDAADLLEFCRTHAEFGFEFMRRAACVLAERLSATRIQLLEIGGIHLPEFQIESD
jgi:CRP-like cAMP-binding protein